MKYTTDQVAQTCGLAPSTVQQYAWKLGLGIKVGRRKMYSKADAHKILKSPIPETKAKPKADQRAKRTSRLTKKKTMANSRKK
jgi:hypothetical protein